MSDSGIHKDHRERMRQRFRQNGFDGFRDHEILEMMLFAAIPRRNTNDIAHELLDRFGDIPSVLTADTAELSKVEGIGDTVAGKIRFLGELYDSVSGEVFRNIALDSEDRVGMYAMLRMSLAPAESATAVYLNDSGMIISEEILYRGKQKMTDKLQDHIPESAAKLGAEAIVLMHNHKHEPLKPSSDDIVITEQLRAKAGELGIKTVYHVIVADDGYIHI